MKLFYSIVSLLFLLQIQAQNFDCTAKTKEYQDFYKSLKVTQAYTIWNEVIKNCPKSSETIYTDGLQILKYLTDNADPTEEKEKLVRETMKIYDQYYKFFPSSCPDFEISKAMVLHDYKIDASEEIYKLLERGFTSDIKSIANPTAVYLYFDSCIKKYRADSKKFDTDFIISRYMLISSLLEQSRQTFPQKKEYQTAQLGIDNLFQQVFNCDQLTAYFEKNFSQCSDTPEWLFSALSCMNESCSNKAIFFKMAQQYYALESSSAAAANFMALANLKQNHFNEAITYFDKYAEMVSDPNEKAAVYYSMANLLFSNPAKSKDYINKALASDPKIGKAYLFLSQLYANNADNCGTNDFEKKAVYYLAVQTAANAGKVEPKLKPSADKMIEEYSKNSLTRKDIKKNKMRGKSFAIKCWINETVSFPKK